MVTAIVIPIILAYFYWLTKKEMQENYQEWLNLEDIPEEAIITGKILEIHEHKERFYYHRFNHVTVLKIMTDSKQVTVRKVTPVRKGASIPIFQKGDVVHLFGNWKQGYFSINRAIKHEEGV
ncbi:hypothetical protein [Mesobacillus subterraneus]|uniref:Uncharacterized protein n=1 Tax=Mesobacillus subterraneus TaxID=285983 RepID=A0A3R9FHJ4_9BACI|nr:hypothetical protein [Mesobacillus subterraneus]RSD28140.1 hypothetical protein EJA10_06700 [Mesobacillus subterraneus]